MSRRAEARNRIRGPQSALTDFLAANNISAAQISADYQQRVNNARQDNNQNADEGDEEGEEEEEDDDGDGGDDDDDDDDEEDPAEQKKRKRKEAKLLHKIKQTKEFKRRKHENRRKKAGGGGDGDDSNYSDDDSDDGGGEGDDDDALARSMMPKSTGQNGKKAGAKQKKMPGQLDNCEACGKRFTVTPYSKAGDRGGLLCPKCSKEAKEREKAQQQKKAKAVRPTAPRARRRQTESDRLMGDVRPGAPSLVDCCVRKVADVANDIDDFGDLPARLLVRLSEILSRKRVLTPRTLGLFLRADAERIDVYDAGRLEEEDYGRIVAHMGARLTAVNLRCAGQMKDAALLRLADACPRLRHLQLGAANLVSDAAWDGFFARRGAQLESLKLSELNDSLRHATVLQLTHHCAAGLRRLKLRACAHLTDASVGALASLRQLEHLSLAAVAAEATTAATLARLVAALGPRLRTLCLDAFAHLDDSTLAAIHAHCRRLAKLRITGSALCTDAAFAALFSRATWPNPPLAHVDLSSNRDVDELRADTAAAAAAAAEDELPRAAVGLGSAAVRALMQHSGSALVHLDLHSDRHIGLDALLDVFGPAAVYPALQDVDLSFVPTVDDVVMRSIFRCCPRLRKLALFACFNARVAKDSKMEIPPSVAVVGLPNAHDHIVQGDGQGI